MKKNIAQIRVHKRRSIASANASGAGSTKGKALKPFRAITRNPGDWTNHFKLLMLKHGLAQPAHEFRTNYVCDNET